MRYFLLMIAAVALVGCGNEVTEKVTPPQGSDSVFNADPTKENNPFIGNWSEFGETVTGDPETWVFHKDGTVDIVDGIMKMNCKYELDGPDDVTIKTFIGPISAKLSKSGDELTSKVGKYRREK